jgi:2,4-dienoyl-CoA reductase-like NADH-dependent reductase (Old Yellow Enzyme family)
VNATHSTLPELAAGRTGAVGLITDPQYANEIVTGGDADLVLVARE